MPAQGEGGTTSAAIAPEVVGAAASVDSIAVDADSVYFVDASREEVRACPLAPVDTTRCRALMTAPMISQIANGKIAMQDGQPVIEPRRIQLMTESFVVSDKPNGSFVVCSKQGCDTSFWYVDRANPDDGPWPFAALGSEVYWAEPDVLAANDVDRTDPTDFSSGTIASATRIVATPASGGHDLFWIDPSGVGTAHVVYPAAKPFAGFTPTHVRTGAATELAVTMRDAWISAPGGLYRVPRDGSSSAPAIAGTITALVADDTGAVFVRADPDGATLLEVRADSGAVTTLVHRAALSAIAIDARHAYFAAEMAILRIPRALQ